MHTCLLYIKRKLCWCVILSVSGLGLKLEDTPQFFDWNILRKQLTDAFASKTQKEWCEIFDNVDACVTPILTPEEAFQYEHNRVRGTFANTNASEERYIPQPAPHLEDFKSPCGNNASPIAGINTLEVLSEIGYSSEELKRLSKAGVVEQTHPSRV